MKSRFPFFGMLAAAGVILSVCLGGSPVEPTRARESVVVGIGDVKIALSAVLEPPALRWPDPFVLSASVVMGRPITGCSVSATVEGPSDYSTLLILSDRDTADDAGESGGPYRATFSDFEAGDGLYEFAVTVECSQESARLVQGGPPGVGPFPDSPSVPSFRRTLHLAGTVEGVPTETAK